MKRVAAERSIKTFFWFCLVRRNDFKIHSRMEFFRSIVVFISRTTACRWLEYFFLVGIRQCSLNFIFSLRSQRTRFQCLVPYVPDAWADDGNDDDGWCWWLGGGDWFSRPIGAKDKRSPPFTGQRIRWIAKRRSSDEILIYAAASNQRPISLLLLFVC